MQQSPLNLFQFTKNTVDILSALIMWRVRLFSDNCTTMNTLTIITMRVCVLLVILAVVDAKRSESIYNCSGLNCTQCINGEDTSVSKACCSICKRFGR